MTASCWGIDWGTAGEWAGAVLVFGTIIYSYVTRRSDRKKHEDELADERALTRDALAQTAASHQLDLERWQVDLADRLRWQANYVTSHLGERQLSQYGSRPYIAVGIRNDSDVAIYAVVMFVEHDNGVFIADESWEALTPGRQVRALVIVNSDADIHAPLSACGVSFRDSSGEWWVRYADGMLRHLNGMTATQYFDERAALAVLSKRQD